MKSKRLVLLVALCVLAACAPYKLQPPLGPMDSATKPLSGSQYVAKADNFEVILDASTSMDEGGLNDFVSARGIVSRINQSLPEDLNYTAGLRSFGHSPYQSENPTELLYGMTGYNKSAFHDALGEITYVGGESPLAAAISAAANDLGGQSGSSALIIVSDGLHMDGVVAAADAAKAKLGGDFCIYTIAVGDEMFGSGQELLQKVAAAGQCGFATTDQELSSQSGLDDFVKKVFLAEKPAPKPVVKPAPKPVAKPAPKPVDSDGDGVVDAADKCPDTPKGELVDENGCSIKLTLQINFDSNSAVIKPEFKDDLDAVDAFIKENSEVPYILIAGHTDSMGASEYNQQLSEKRANAVRQALIDNYGVAADRLRVKGYGEEQPIASNETKEGRYQNRRVEVVCCFVLPE